MRENEDRANLRFPRHFLDIRFISISGGTLDIGRYSILKEGDRNSSSSARRRFLSNW